MCGVKITLGRLRRGLENAPSDSDTTGKTVCRGTSEFAAGQVTRQSPVIDDEAAAEIDETGSIFHPTNFFFVK